jgi:hypothetical protein
MIIRNFGTPYDVADYTAEINVIPNQWGLLGQMGLFQEESVAEHTVVFEEYTKDGALIVDRVRGDRAFVGKDGSRKIHSFVVPHFPYDDAISPQDLQGKRAYGSDSAETLEAVRARKLERLRQNWAWTMEYARAYTLTTGQIYAPNGTVTQDWYTEMGQTKKVIDWALDTSTTELTAKFEEAIAHVLDNTGGESVTGTVVLCSPEWFAKLIKHPKIVQAYTYYSSTQEPLRQRLGGDFSLRREFRHGGLHFIEMRDSYVGQRLIPAGKAFMVPLGTSAFKTYFSPAQRFGLVNTLGEQIYVFESRDPKGMKIEIETESNFVNAMFRPQLVVEFQSNS